MGFLFSLDVGGRKGGGWALISSFYILGQVNKSPVVHHTVVFFVVFFLCGHWLHLVTLTSAHKNYIFIFIYSQIYHSISTSHSSDFNLGFHVVKLDKL